MSMARGRLLAGSLLLLAVTGVGASSLSAGPRPGARRLPDARGVAYAAEVAPGLYRGGQPSAEGVTWLKSIGIKTVLNLRHYHGDTEKQQVESVGLRYERIPLTSRDAPSAAEVARFLALVRDPKLRPLYVHCEHGVDRTGAMMAVYRMEEEGWSNDDAFAEMESFGAHFIWQDLRNFVRAYRPQKRR
jgi:tyrosine-protein phosphatase SIW14